MRQLIVAHDLNGVIGKDGGMPWEGQLPSDMRHFRQLTSGQAVIMGRKTFESIGKPLPNRMNIVLSSQTDLEIQGCTVVHDLETGFEIAEVHDHTFVIGGSKVYELAMPHVDRLEVTIIEASFEGDTYFIDIDPNTWELTQSEAHAADERNEFNCRFERYERIVR